MVINAILRVVVLHSAYSPTTAVCALQTFPPGGVVLWFVHSRLLSPSHRPRPLVPSSPPRPLRTVGAPYTSFIQQIGDSQDPSGTVQDCVPFYGHGQDPADPAWGAAFPLIANWVGKYGNFDIVLDHFFPGFSALCHLTGAVWCTL